MCLQCDITVLPRLTTDLEELWYYVLTLISCSDISEKCAGQVLFHAIFFICLTICQVTLMFLPSLNNIIFSLLWCLKICKKTVIFCNLSSKVLGGHGPHWPPLNPPLDTSIKLSKCHVSLNRQCEIAWSNAQLYQIHIMLSDDYRFFMLQQFIIF